MSRKHLSLIALLLALLLVACGGGAPAAEAPAAEAPAAEEPAAEEPAVQPTAAPKNTIAPKATATPAPTEVVEEPTDDDDSGAGAADTGDLRQIQDIESIRTFRQRTQISASGAAFDDYEGLFTALTMEMAYVREPVEAYQVSMELPNEENESGTGTINIIQVGDRSFIDFGMGSWIESGDEGSPFDVDEISFLDLASLAANLDELEVIGTEEVNGRSTTHYRGDREVLAALSSADGSDFSGVEEAQLDVWIDREEMFVVKMEMTAEGIGMNPEMSDASGTMTVTTDVFDINSDDIVIEVPEIGAGLNEALGFDLQLPENARVDFSMEGMTSISFTDSTAEEVATFFEETMTAAGYELDTSGSSPEFGLYLFTMGDKSVNLTISESDGTVSVIIMQ